jgi:hypothetical protein
MLPKQITALTDRFIRIFDSERPAEVEFRRAHDEATEWQAQEEVVWGGGAMITVGKNVTAYVDDRARFIWRKLQEAVASTELEAYAELSSDLKLQIANYCNPVRQAAERYMEELRQSTDAPAGDAVEAKGAFANVLSKINSEVDLFCARYTANRNRETPSAVSQLFELGNSHGIAGDGIPSRVMLNDCAARRLLIGHNIPKQSKRTRTFIAVCSFLLLGIGAYVAYRLRKHS